MAIQDDASDWFASQGQQVQDYEAPAPPMDDTMVADVQETDNVEPDRPFGDAPMVTDEDVRNVINMRIAQKPTAELIEGVMDVIIPLVLVLLIKPTAPCAHSWRGQGSPTCWAAGDAACTTSKSPSCSR